MVPPGAWAEDGSGLANLRAGRYHAVQRDVLAGTDLRPV